MTKIPIEALAISKPNQIHTKTVFKISLIYSSYNVYISFIIETL